MNDRTLFKANVISDIPKIKDGSLVMIGELRALTVSVDHHFNWLQKKMIRW